MTNYKQTAGFDSREMELSEEAAIDLENPGSELTLFEQLVAKDQEARDNWERFVIANSPRQYHAVRDGDQICKFLVIAHGTAGQVAQAKSILETAGATQADVHKGIKG